MSVSLVLLIFTLFFSLLLSIEHISSKNVEHEHILFFFSII